MTGPPRGRARHLRGSDLRGIAQLATQATEGVARIVEGVHQSVWKTLGVAGGKQPAQTGGVTGLVYASVRGITRLVGKSLDTVLARLEPLLESGDDGDEGTSQRLAVIAALNGVMGDRLAAGGSPFATVMSLRHEGRVLGGAMPPAPMPGVTGKVLLLVHGLCMNDLQWQRQRDGQLFDHGRALASARGYTPVYLRYNTGLHVSENGRLLSVQLEQLAGCWPRPLEEITVLAHSMGGLVIRSALRGAQQQNLRWPACLKNIVFLGTPHHGAPLERAGSWVDVLLGATPYTAPLAKLGQLRSAGITDLRHGLGQSLPLPQGVSCYAVAATTAGRRSALADRLVGDGLVPLRSALGQHDDASRTLAFPPAAQRIVYRTNHMQLLESAEVAEQLVNWLAPV